MSNSLIDGFTFSRFLYFFFFCTPSLRLEVFGRFSFYLFEGLMRRRYSTKAGDAILIFDNTSWHFPCMGNGFLWRGVGGSCAELAKP
jgi:hypothetical protein